MPAIHETAYPRIKSNLSEREAGEGYTPVKEELVLVDGVARGETKLCLLVMLKVFQRLGYFLPLAEVPKVIVRQVAKTAGSQGSDESFAEYDRSITRKRHMTLIRQHMKVHPYGTEARKVIVRTVAEAARTKDTPADLINVAIEELVRQRFELPAFSTLNRISRRVRVVVYRSFYRQINSGLDDADRASIDALFRTSLNKLRSPWNDVKEDPKQATLTTLREHVKYLAGLQKLQVGATSLIGIPDVKVKQFAAEAKALDAARMVDLQPAKRYTLACSLLAVQTARAHDDMAEIFIKRMASMHKKGKEALADYLKQHRKRTDELIEVLHDVLEANRAQGSRAKRQLRIDAILEPQSDELWQDCVAHLTYANDNYYPFLWNYYKSHRPTLFGIIKTVQLRTTSQEAALEQAVKFIVGHEETRADWLPAYHEEGRGKKKERTPLLDLSWVSPKWWGLICETKRGVYPDVSTAGTLRFACSRRFRMS